MALTTHTNTPNTTQTRGPHPCHRGVGRRRRGLRVAARSPIAAGAVAAAAATAAGEKGGGEEEGGRAAVAAAAAGAAVAAAAAAGERLARAVAGGAAEGLCERHVQAPAAGCSCVGDGVVIWWVRITCVGMYIHRPSDRKNAPTQSHPQNRSPTKAAAADTNGGGDGDGSVPDGPLLARILAWELEQELHRLFASGGVLLAGGGMDGYRTRAASLRVCVRYAMLVHHPTSPSLMYHRCCLTQTPPPPKSQQHTTNTVQPHGHGQPAAAPARAGGGDHAGRALPHDLGGAGVGRGEGAEGGARPQGAAGACVCA